MQENSIATDYVTEKLYDAFVAGCVPVYYGAPNVEDLLPDPDSIIDCRHTAFSHFKHPDYICCIPHRCSTCSNARLVDVCTETGLPLDSSCVVIGRAFGSTAALRKEILRVSGNRAVWESKVAWRKRRLGQLSPAFQAQVAHLHSKGPKCTLFPER